MIGNSVNSLGIGTINLKLLPCSDPDFMIQWF